MVLHYNSGDDYMSKDELWELFKETGKIEYYLKYKKAK